MADHDLTPAQIAEITAYVDIAAPPPDRQPTAHLIFGTNQARPVKIVAERFHRGLALPGYGTVAWPSFGWGQRVAILTRRRQVGMTRHEP